MESVEEKISGITFFFHPLQISGNNHSHPKTEPLPSLVDTAQISFLGSSDWVAQGTRIIFFEGCCRSDINRDGMLRRWWALMRSRIRWTFNVNKQDFDSDPNGINNIIQNSKPCFDIDLNFINNMIQDNNLNIERSGLTDSVQSNGNARVHRMSTRRSGKLRFTR